MGYHDTIDTITMSTNFLKKNTIIFEDFVILCILKGFLEAFDCVFWANTGDGSTVLSIDYFASFISIHTKKNFSHSFYDVDVNLILRIQDDFWYSKDWSSIWSSIRIKKRILNFKFPTKFSSQQKFSVDRTNFIRFQFGFKQLNFDRFYAFFVQSLANFAHFFPRVCPFVV